MTVDNPEDPDISIHVCRIKRSQSDIDMIAWADGYSAKQYCEQQSPVELEWRIEDDGRQIGESSGAIIATIDEVDVADPGTLSREFPSEMRSWTYIDPEEL